MDMGKYLFPIFPREICIKFPFPFLVGGRGVSQMRSDRSFVCGEREIVRRRSLRSCPHNCTAVWVEMGFLLSGEDLQRRELRSPAAIFQRGQTMPPQKKLLKLSSNSLPKQIEIEIKEYKELEKKRARERSRQKEIARHEEFQAEMEKKPDRERRKE